MAETQIFLAAFSSRGRSPKAEIAYHRWQCGRFSAQFPALADQDRPSIHAHELPDE